MNEDGSCDEVVAIVSLHRFVEAAAAQDARYYDVRNPACNATLLLKLQDSSLSIANQTQPTHSMKSLLRLLLTVLSLLLTQTVGMAQNAPPVAGQVREFKDMLKAVPSKDLLKLRGNDKLQSAMTISQQITAREVGKEGIYHGKVTRIEPWPFPQLGITGWRLAIEDQIKQGSTTMGVFAWVLVHKDPNGVIPKLRVGKDITVSGKISRTELSLPDQPRLNVDLTVLEMTMQK